MMATAPLIHSNGVGIGRTAKTNRPRVEIGYGKPKSYAVSIKNSAGKMVFRFDYDPYNGIHARHEQRMRFGKFTGEGHLQ